MKKILTITILLCSITSLKAQQVFKPVIIDLIVGSSSYTVPSDSILKVESIGIRNTQLVASGSSAYNYKALKINGKSIYIHHAGGSSGLYYEHKTPFWLPENTVIALPVNNNTYGEYQIYGLLFPK